VTSQHSALTSEESVDLRKIIETLLRRWWLIAAVLAISFIVSVGFSVLVQTPVYESSGSAGLPVASSDTQLGLTPSDYLALASSDTQLGLTPSDYLALASSSPVMDSVREQIDSDLSPSQLRTRFKFGLLQTQTVTFTASADSAEQSFLLADAWLKAYQRELESLIMVQLDQIKEQTAQEIKFLLPQLTRSEEELERYDLENDQSLLEIKLSTLQSGLADKERRLQELMAFSIPTNEVRLASLQSVVGLESGGISGGGGSPDAIQPGEAFSEILIPADTLAFKSNPTYIELSQNLTRSQLSALENALVSTEDRLRELKYSSIPNAKSRLVSLEKALATEPAFLGQPGSSVDLTLNPVYVRLSQDLSDTKILLDVERSEAVTLSTAVGVLREQIDDLRVELLFRQEIQKTKSVLALDRKGAEVLETTILELRPEIRELSARVRTERAAHLELKSDVTEIQTNYELAEGELDRLAIIENRLASYAQLNAVQEPSQPASPVSPQRGRNIGLAMFLGLIIGVSGALLMDYYQGRPTPETPLRG